MQINYDWIYHANFICCFIGTCGHGWYISVSIVGGSNIIYYRTVLLFFILLKPVLISLARLFIFFNR